MHPGILLAVKDIQMDLSWDKAIVQQILYVGVQLSNIAAYLPYIAAYSNNLWTLLCNFPLQLIRKKNVLQNFKPNLHVTEGHKQQSLKSA